MSIDMSKNIQVLSGELLTQSEIAKRVNKDVSAISRIVKKYNIPKVNGKIDFTEYGFFFTKPKTQFTYNVNNDLIDDDIGLQDLQKKILLQQEKKIKWEAEMKRLEVETEISNLIPKEKIYEFVDKVASELKKLIADLPKKIIKISENIEDANLKNKLAEAEVNKMLEQLLNNIGDSFDDKE